MSLTMEIFGQLAFLGALLIMLGMLTYTIVVSIILPRTDEGAFQTANNLVERVAARWWLCPGGAVLVALLVGAAGGGQISASIAAVIVGALSMLPGRS